MAVSEGPIANIKGSSQVAGEKTPQHVLVVDGTGSAVTFGGSGGTSSTDEAGFTAGVTLGTPAMGVYETTPTTLTNNQQGIIGLTANRELKVSVTSGGTAGTQYTEGDTDSSITGTALMLEGAANTLVAAPGTAADGLLVNLGTNNDVTVTGTVTANAGTGTFAVGDGGGSLTVDGTVGVSGTVTVDTELPNAAALADNASNPTAPAVGAFGMVWDGSTWDRQPGTSADGTLVNLGANNDVTVTGTVTANAGTGTFAVGDGGGSLTVDGSVSITGSVDTELPNAAALADNTANPTAPAVGAFGHVWDGSTWDRAPGTSTDGTLVNLGANNDVTITGTGTLATNQVSVTTTATQIVASRSGRRSVTVIQHGSTAVYLGPTSGVTTSNGILLIGTAGAAVTFEYSGAVYGIVSSGSVTVGYAEEY